MILQILSTPKEREAMLHWEEETNKVPIEIRHELRTRAWFEIKEIKEEKHWILNIWLDGILCAFFTIPDSVEECASARNFIRNGIAMGNLDFVLYAGLREAERKKEGKEICKRKAKRKAVKN